MRLLRALVVVALFVVAVYYGYRVFAGRPRPVAAATVTVYYCKTDGQTLVPWKLTLGPARDRKSVAFYAATQAVAGPSSDIDAIRFPSGTIVHAVDVDGSTAIVDLGGALAKPTAGSFAESAEFKALVWTLTALPGIGSVQVKLDGIRVPTLPGGHFELDEPLSRASF